MCCIFCWHLLSHGWRKDVLKCRWRIQSHLGFELVLGHAYRQAIVIGYWQSAPDCPLFCAGVAFPRKRIAGGPLNAWPLEWIVVLCSSMCRTCEPQSIELPGFLACLEMIFSAFGFLPHNFSLLKDIGLGFCNVDIQLKLCLASIKGG